MKNSTQRHNFSLLKKIGINGILFLLLGFFSPYSLQANTTIFSSVEAIGTCVGITAAEENTYNLTITGLDATVLYDFDLNGDGVNEITHFTGASTFTTNTENKTNIPFIDGTATQLVQIDESANGIYDWRIMVHEVLCTDADNDGDLDFSAGCNAAKSAKESGYIVATTAPYNSTNVYLYVLTTPTGNALAANTAGLFTNLSVDATTDKIDYQVMALNFPTKTDVQDFITGLRFDAITGTNVTPTTMLSMECATVCGTMAYDLSCRIDDVALTKKVVSTSNTKNLNIGDKVTFEIEIFNQGTAPIYDVVIKDLFQNGYHFLIADNQKNAFSKIPNNITGGGMVTTTIAGPIASNSNQVIEIVLTINANANHQNLTNLAEIIEARQTPNGPLIADVDNDLMNQLPPIENEIDNEIADNPTDQDDFDFAQVALAVPIPTMGTWGLLIFGLLILNMGGWIIRTRLVCI